LDITVSSALPRIRPDDSDIAAPKSFRGFAVTSCKPLGVVAIFLVAPEGPFEYRYKRSSSTIATGSLHSARRGYETLGHATRFPQMMEVIHTAVSPLIPHPGYYTATRSGSKKLTNSRPICRCGRFWTYSPFFGETMDGTCRPVGQFATATLVFLQPLPRFRFVAAIPNRSFLMALIGSLWSGNGNRDARELGRRFTAS